MAIHAPMPNSVHVLALAHQGHLDEARALGAADLAADESVGFDVRDRAGPPQPGHGGLWAGEAALAAEHLLRAVTVSTHDVGIREPAIPRAHPHAGRRLSRSDGSRRP